MDIMFYMANRNPIIESIFFIAIFILVANINLPAEQRKEIKLNKDPNLNVTVYDSLNNTPVELATLILRRSNKTVMTKITDFHGSAVFREINAGRYILLVHFIGYKDYSNIISIKKNNKNIRVLLIPQNIKLAQIIVQGTKEINVSNYIDKTTGNQIISPDTYHASPEGGMTKFITENVPGAVKQPAGQMVINDQHLGYSNSTYYLNGAPIPTGILGSMNEIINPEIVQQINSYTSGFPAEYGGQSAAVFSIKSKIPSYVSHFSFSSYIGSYLTSDTKNLGNNVGLFKKLNSNGQSISFSNHERNFRYFISGSRQETDRRLDQPVKQLFHDHGFDYFLFGKTDLLLSKNNYFTSNLSFSKTLTQIPFDPAEGKIWDTQSSYNSFQTLSFYHYFDTNSEKESKILAAFILSERGLNYLTDYKNDQIRLKLNPDSSISFTLNQDRKYFTYGARVKYSKRLSYLFKYAIGGKLVMTNADEIFNLKNYSGYGPKYEANFPSSLFALFFQTKFDPLNTLSIRLGLRYDQSISPSIPLQRLFSPRIKVIWSFNDDNTLYFSYDKLFLPVNAEGLNYLAEISNSGSTGHGTYPEKDDLFESGLIHDFNSDLTMKLDYFIKSSFPGLDDEQLGSSSIMINVNIQKIKVSGIELSFDYNEPLSPFSFYINGSIMHGYGEGIVSGGFQKLLYNPHPFDLDHDQRLTLVSGLNFQERNTFMKLFINYGSGLTNGNDSYKYKTGLFDLNQGAHTTPAWTVNLSVGYKFMFTNGMTIQPSIYITNLFDHSHLIKGALLNSAYYEARRNIVFKVRYES